MWFLAWDVKTDYYISSPWNCSYFNAYNFIQTCSDLKYICTHGKFNNHTAHHLYSIITVAVNAMGVMKMGNIGTRAGIKPISLVIRKPFCHLGSLISPSYPRLSVYVAACMRHQWRLTEHNNTNMELMLYVFAWWAIIGESVVSPWLCARSWSVARGPVI